MSPVRTALAIALTMAPVSAQGADLVVWWEKGFYPQVDEALVEVIAAFEQSSGKTVELSLEPQAGLADKIAAALQAGKPPDFVFGLWLTDYMPQWALDDRLVDLSDAIGPLSDLFDQDALEWGESRDQKTGQKVLYGLPVGQATSHVHVWKRLLEPAGFTLEDIPREWQKFWSFWCDEVQPAVRQATGRDDIWGIGLPMSMNTYDTTDQFTQFVTAYDAHYVTRDGRLVIDDPEVRQRLIEAIESYTAIHRKRCTPPGSTSWGDIDNNEQFLAQSVVMTANLTLSIPNALKREHPGDYHDNVATIEWPLNVRGETFPIAGEVFLAMAFEEGGNAATVKQFVRFLVEEGWLMHYLNFSGERFLPPIPKLLDQPFWLDPTDRHRMAAAIQVSERGLTHNYAAASGEWRHDLVEQERVWAKAIHRVAAEGISPEQAVDEAIARIKEILGE
jgi:multiple sugar transport system substrate-binding protein